MTPDPLPLSRRGLAAWPHLRDARHERDEAHAARVLGLTEREVAALRRLRANLGALPPRAEWIGIAGDPLPAEIPAQLLAGLWAGEELAPMLARAFAPPFLGGEEAFRRALAPLLVPRPAHRPTLTQQVAELVAEWEIALDRPVFADDYARLCGATGCAPESVQRALRELRTRHLTQPPLVVWTGAGEEEERPMEIGSLIAEAWAQTPPPAPAAPVEARPATPHLKTGPRPRADALRPRFVALCAEWGIDPLAPITGPERARLAEALGSTPGSLSQILADLRREAGAALDTTPAFVTREQATEGGRMEERLVALRALLAERGIPLSRMLGRHQREELAAALGITRDQFEYACKAARKQDGVKVERTGVCAIDVGRNGAGENKGGGRRAESDNDGTFPSDSALRPPPSALRCPPPLFSPQVIRIDAAPDPAAVLAAAEEVTQYVLALGMGQMTAALSERLTRLVGRVLAWREGG